MSVKYISDLHLYDPTSVEWRPEFSSMLEYPKYLTEQWNNFTDSDDIVILAGDVGILCQQSLDILVNLKGHKILVVGNHDSSWLSQPCARDIFDGIHDSIEQNNIFINHIPERYDGSCQFYIHGHHHRYDMPGMNGKLQQYAADTYRLNCAADLNKHRPCTLQELIMNKELLLDKYRNMGLI